MIKMTDTKNSSVVIVNRPATDIEPKVTAATVGAGAGGALAELLLWWTETHLSLDLPDGPIYVLIPLLFAFIAGYMKRSSPTHTHVK